MVDTSQDEGITLVEVLVTISLMSVLMAIAVSGWSAWAASSAHRGAAEELQSNLRQTQQLAVTTGTSMCVIFSDNREYTIYRGACDSTKTPIEGPILMPRDDVLLEAASIGSGVTFQARGAAVPLVLTDNPAGEIEVRRSGSTHKVVINWLTGRVSIG